ncbi:leucine-rich repeat flightless-interacting protein 2 isoform X15 [Lates calcarifer]|uniref:Leucine-rich repeat flightless-interacting protein 2 isoform X15 n=1 Tax=Lates calcarifer TaxID=8187 RepID=A0AAJ7PJT5_LATCA|nr:leucine-rich repeat flightless-interacting protein 2 isoform X15 [Lates calcarifer]
MGTQGPGRKRIPNRERLTAEDDALNQIAREAEARLAAKRAARAEAREIRMKELERQQKELFHSHKKYYGLDNKWGHIEQWMEDSERYSRHSRRHTSISDDEERMSVGSRGSLRPSDYSGFLGSSSRASSRASSARASPVVEERPDRDFLDKGSRTASTLSAATLASLGGASSRRGSCDTSFSVETEASIREIKGPLNCVCLWCVQDSLAEAEEKYRKAMVSNAQLHNEKTTLMYQVETLREELSDMEEVLWEARRHCDDTTKEFERERQAHSVLQFQFKEMKETLRQTEELLTEVSELRLKSSSYCQEVSDLQEALQWKEKKISALERQREISDIVRIERDRLRDEVIRLRDLLKKHGVVVSPEITTNGETGHGEADDDVSAESGSQLAQEASHGRESMLELRLKKLFEDRESLQDQVRLLKSQLDQRQKIGSDGVQDPKGDGLENGMDSHLLDLQRDANRQISDLKFKLVKSEQEVTALEQNIIRLEGQVTRYKSASENAEKVEDELKVEKRKLQRELRSALDRIEELEASNAHLSKRLEKMKANRNALLAQQ